MTPRFGRRLNQRSGRANRPRLSRALILVPDEGEENDDGDRHTQQPA